MHTVSPTVRKDKHTAPEMKACVCVCEWGERERQSERQCLCLCHEMYLKTEVGIHNNGPQEPEADRDIHTAQTWGTDLITNLRPPCPLSPPGVW